ncbi:MAG TPA: RidA family protein [Candidatus Baltobacteraceae bacterium]|nr:RidA family protein [Candidatus Baltobacteraceae bacterium]
MSVRRIGPGPRMSRAVVHGDTVYLGGQTPKDASADVAGQTRQILEQIDALLAEAGSSHEKIVSVTIWLRDIASFEAMNAVWDAWVSKDNPPARACVESRLAKPEWLVEMHVVASL